MNREDPRDRLNMSEEDLATMRNYSEEELRLQDEDFNNSMGNFLKRNRERNIVEKSEMMKFLPLYKKDTKERIEKDPKYREFINKLVHEFTDRFVLFRPITVKTSEGDITLPPIFTRTQTVNDSDLTSESISSLLSSFTRYDRENLPSEYKQKANNILINVFGPRLLDKDELEKNREVFLQNDLSVKEEEGGNIDGQEYFEEEWE